MRSGDLLNPLCRHSPRKDADAAPLFARLSMPYSTFCKRDVSGRCCRRIFRPLPRYMVTSSALKAMTPGYEFMMLFTARHVISVSYTHLRAHETDSYLVCRLLLEKKKKQNKHYH